MRDAGSVRPTVRAVPPLGYLDFVALEADARLLLTDSGSVQAEASALGVPCLTLRDTTERHDTLGDGGNELVGADPERILTAARSVLGAQSWTARPWRPAGGRSPYRRRAPAGGFLAMLKRFRRTSVLGAGRRSSRSVSAGDLAGANRAHAMASALSRSTT